MWASSISLRNKVPRSRIWEWLSDTHPIPLLFSYPVDANTIGMLKSPCNSGKWFKISYDFICAYCIDLVGTRQCSLMHLFFKVIINWFFCLLSLYLHILKMLLAGNLFVLFVWLGYAWFYNVQAYYTGAYVCCHCSKI